MGSGTDGTFVLENFYCRFGMELAEVGIALTCWSPQLPSQGCWDYRLCSPTLLYRMLGTEPSSFLVLNQYFPN